MKLDNDMMTCHRTARAAIFCMGTLALFVVTSPGYSKSKTCVPCVKRVHKAHSSACPGPNPIGMGFEQNSSHCCYMGQDYGVMVRTTICKVFGVPFLHAWAYCGGSKTCADSTISTRYGHNYTPDAYHTSACCDEMGSPCGQNGHCVFVGTYMFSTRGCQDAAGNDLQKAGCNWWWTGCDICAPVNCPAIAPPSNDCTCLPCQCPPHQGGVPGACGGFPCGGVGVGPVGEGTAGGPPSGQTTCVQSYDLLGHPHCNDPGSCPSRTVNGKRGMCRCDWKGYP